jgi:hypothetical protein
MAVASSNALMRRSWGKGYPYQEGQNSQGGIKNEPNGLVHRVTPEIFWFLCGGQS